MTENYLNKVEAANEAFTIWKNHKNYIYKILKQWKCQDMEDAYHQSFVYILLAVSKFNKERGINKIAWTLSIMKQRLFDYVKTKCQIISNPYYARKNPDLRRIKEVLRIDRDNEGLSLEIPDKSPEPSYYAEMSIISDFIDKVIKKLNPRQEYIIRRYYGIGAEPEDVTTIADELGANVKSIYDSLRHARLKMMRIINRNYIYKGDLLDYEA